MSDYDPAFLNEVRKVFRDLAEEILQHKARILDEDNMEAVHKTRVATNKLRVALNSFLFAIPKKLSRSLQSDLEWFKDSLAAVRDSDVIRNLVTDLGDPPYENDRLGVDEIRRVLREERKEYLATLSRAIECDAYQQLDADLVALLKKMKALKKQTAECEPGSTLLQQNLADTVLPLYEKFEERRKKLSASFDPPIMHRMRIAAKKLRYVLDFLADCRSEVYPAISEKLHELHDCTGNLHDMDVLVPKIEKLAAHWHMTLSAEENQRLETGIEWLLWRLYVKRRELMKEFYGLWATVSSEDFAKPLLTGTTT